MEMATMTKSFIDILAQRGQRIARLYTGPFMTALDMTGLSITILRIGDLLPLLDHPTTAPAWTNNTMPFSGDLSSRLLSVARVAEEPPLTSNLLFTARDASIAQSICSALIAAEPQLTAYDSICGDGDCGLVLKKGATQVQKCLANLVDKDAAEACKVIADAIAESMGGTSGALLEIFFRTAAVTLMEIASPIVREGTASDWSKGFIAGVEAIRRYGGADRGMRTMLDALLPASQALREGEGISVVASAAEQGAEETKEMKSEAGRANYVVFERLAGTPDPGAVAVALALAAVRDHQ